jgi:phosphate transport system substrate-binding protein
VNISKRAVLGLTAALSLVAAACGDDDGGDSSTTAGAPTTQGGATTAPAGEAVDLTNVSGSLFVTGSSTVEPISIKVGELARDKSRGKLAVTVEGPGTGDGFVTFCAGEADITDASRTIRDTEAQTCADNGVDFVELAVAVDGLTVATSPTNTAVECLDTQALYALLGPEAEGMVSKWNDAKALATELGSTHADTLPDLDLVVTGPGEESGTYDTFVEFAIAPYAENRGQESVVRADYTSSANDNLIVEGIEGADGSLGWVGYAYYAGEKERMKAIAIAGGDGTCVAPADEAISDGTYPFSRTLYIYVNKAKAKENPAVAGFVDLYLSGEGLAQVRAAGYVTLHDDAIGASLQVWNAAKA